MKKLAILIFLLIPTFLLAEKNKGLGLQMPDFQFSTGNGGYYSSPVYFGGNMGFFPNKEGFVATVNPIFGARITRRFHLGISSSILFQQQNLYVPNGLDSTKYKYQGANYDVSLFARYFILSGLFLHAEPGIINTKVASIYYDYTDAKVIEESERINVPNLLGGVGFAVPVGQQSILVFTALYDFYQDENSPYGKYPFLRGGFNLGF